jgi:hypothetical protein
VSDMRDYQTNEAMFPIPDDWVDGSNNILQIDDEADGHIRVLVLRAAVEGRTLAQFVEWQIKEFSRRISFFKIVSQGERPLAGRPTATLRATTREKGGEMLQESVTFQAGESFVSLMVVGLTRAEKQIDALFERVTSTVKFKK